MKKKELSTKEEKQVVVKRLIRECDNCHIGQTNVVFTYDGLTLCTDCAAAKYAKENNLKGRLCIGCGLWLNDSDSPCIWCGE